MMFALVVLLLAPLLPSFLASARLLCVRDPVIDLGYSQYQGVNLPNGITQWLGMRYAASPVGQLRFRAPQDPISNPNLQIANAHGDVCLSTPGTTPIPQGYSEDCLFVDVYAPTAARQGSPLPVYVYIQGGGFNSNSNPNYNGSGLITASDMSIVVVTFNYRVGPYGFLASEEVKANGDVNNGLLDQRKLFEWVQSHINKFGGDPKKVTIGGSSAGGASIALHLTAYGGRNDDLFHAAASESQSFAAQLTIQGSQYQYDALIQRAGCNSTQDTLACLRDLTATELQAINTNIPTPGGGGKALVFMYSNVLDGNFTQDLTYRMFQQGKFIRVPVIFGDDTNGGTIFVPSSTNTTTDMNTFLTDQYATLNTSELSTIDKLYPKAEQFPGTGEYWRAAANAYGQMRFMCPGLYISGAYFNTQTPSWNYRYNVEDPTQEADGYGVPHTVEVNAIWGPQNVKGTAPASYSTYLNRNAIPLMQGYWTSFIRAHDPNLYRMQGSPEWEQYDPAKANRILLQTNTTTMETVDQATMDGCSYFESIAIALLQ